MGCRGDSSEPFRVDGDWLGVTFVEDVGWDTEHPGQRVTRPDFEDFYREHWSDVAGFSAALAGSALLGDDMAQEAFARLYPRWRLVREPRPYVFRIAANLARRHNRRAAREVLIEVTPDAGTIPAGVDPGLMDAVNRLPERLRVVVLLHYYADLPIDQVATCLRRPVGSIKRQLHEARSTLAQAMGDADD